MRKWFQKHFERYMIRPLIYKTFTRLILTVFFVLLIEHFVPRTFIGFTKANLFLFSALLWLLGAWISHLRMRGFHFPRFDLQRWRRKDPLRNYGSMADHIDDPIVTYEDLADSEKDFCTLLADAFLFLLFLIVSFCV